MVRDKARRPPDELGVSKSMERNIFTFSALTLLVGRQEWHLACKITGCWFVFVDDGLELCTSCGSSCHHHLCHPLRQ